MRHLDMVSRPFFMTLPGYPGRMDENEILNDLEYLQQTYPERSDAVSAELRKYWTNTTMKEA
jgi:hypothetical protein